MPPAEFAEEDVKEEALEMGFDSVGQRACVRSSYNAKEQFLGRPDRCRFR